MLLRGVGFFPSPQKVFGDLALWTAVVQHNLDENPDANRDQNEADSRIVQYHGANRLVDDSIGKKHG